MVIVCPSCASEYEVDPDRIGAAGREVRCGQCQHAWFVDARAAATDAPDQTAGTGLVPFTAADGASVGDAQEGAVARPRRSPPRARAGRNRKGVAAKRQPKSTRQRLAIAIIVATVIATPALVFMRKSVVRAFPESAILFSALGLPVNLVGLRLADVTSGLFEEAAGRVLVVEGEMKAVASGSIPVPKLEFTVEGEHGETLYRWTTPPPIAEISSGEGARFTARLSGPPPAGRKVVVSFKAGAGEHDIALQ